MASALTEGSHEPQRINMRNVSEIASQQAVEDSVDALLRASDGDPVTAIAAMAEAVWKRNNGTFAGADAVLYRTLQAQLSGKYRSVLEGPHASTSRAGVVGKKGTKPSQLSLQQPRAHAAPKPAAGDDHGHGAPILSPYRGAGQHTGRRTGGGILSIKPHPHSRTAPAAGVGEFPESSPAKLTTRSRPGKPGPAGAVDFAEEPAGEAAEGEEPAPAEGNLLSHRAGAKAYSSMSTRKSLRGLRSISAPVPPRPVKARSVPGGDKSATLEATTVAAKRDRTGSTVDIHSWLIDRRRKEREREEMRQARLKNDARFIEKLDERQAERNKLLQEAEERLAQSIAGKKGQKWKPVPFTPWPDANKQAEVVTEDTIFKNDVDRLFGVGVSVAQEEKPGAQGGNAAAAGGGAAKTPAAPKTRPSGKA